MSNLYSFLSYFEFIPLGLFLACIAYKYSTRWNFYLRASLGATLVTINIIQLIMEIQMEKNIIISALMISMWGVNLMGYFFQYHSKKNSWK